MHYVHPHQANFAHVSCLRRLARLEHLMERRPILLSSVMLRQNPHNVHEWHKRVKLFNGQPHKQILTYTEAVTTVDVEKVSGHGCFLKDKEGFNLCYEE